MARPIQAAGAPTADGLVQGGAAGRFARQFDLRGNDGGFVELRPQPAGG